MDRQIESGTLLRWNSANSRGYAVKEKYLQSIFWRTILSVETVDVKGTVKVCSTAGAHLTSDSVLRAFKETQQSK